MKKEIIVVTSADNRLQQIRHTNRSQAKNERMGLRDKILFLNQKMSTMADNQRGQGNRDQNQNAGGNKSNSGLGNSGRSGQSGQQQNTGSQSGSQQPGTGKAGNTGSGSSGNSGNRSSNR